MRHLRLSWQLAADGRVVVQTAYQIRVVEGEARLVADILRDVPDVVSVTYNVAPKPPSTIEAV